MSQQRGTGRIEDLKAAVVGTGFIGLVHVEALRRLGVEVLGVVGSSPGRARAKAGAYPLPPVYESLEQALDDPAVDVVHLTTPNHLHHPQAVQALAAGKHVVCEKPLALDSAQSAELLGLAERSGLVHCTNFNARFYPQCREARDRVRAGELGELWNVHGVYLQDWLLLPTDWNWRLEPERGGPLRAISDIGSHWLDLVEFVGGRRVESLLADLATAVPTRRRPTGPVETFAPAQAGETEPVEVLTDDFAHVLLRFEGGMRGSCTISQVSAGRRNLLAFELDGAHGSLAWSSERNEELWLGHRGRPNETLWRERGSVPPGHPEGFQDTFKDLYAAVYAAVVAGEPGDGYPTFRDGHRSNVLGDAVLRSHREERWVEVET
jgi:predicted dehydrogenase